MTSLDDANTSKWKIKGIRCTHLIRHGMNVPFYEGVFEMVHSHLERVHEIVIEEPVGEISVIMAQIILSVLEERYGKKSFILKGVEALSDDKTLFRFLRMDSSIDCAEATHAFSVAQELAKPTLEEIRQVVREEMGQLKDEVREHRVEFRLHNDPLSKSIISYESEMSLGLFGKILINQKRVVPYFKKFYDSLKSALWK